jgi:heme-degrading monooxygenase HmoA
MAVLILTRVKGQTQEGYDSVLSAVEQLVKKAPGFIMHGAHPFEDGWNVIEVWNSKREADQWFAKDIVPNLPPGIHPKRAYYTLYSLLTPDE